MSISKTLNITSRAEWREWLAGHHESETEVWLIYYKKHTLQPRIPYEHAVEEALCFGWIDSIVKRIDDEKFAQKFTPRRDRTEPTDMGRRDSDLQAAYANAIRNGTPAEQAAARREWLGAWVSYTGAGKGSHRPPKSGKRVFDCSEVASRSGQLSLAAIEATRRGTRPATLDEIEEVLRSWGDNGNLWDSRGDHFHTYMVKQGWAKFDKVNNVLNLTEHGKRLV